MSEKKSGLGAGAFFEVPEKTTQQPAKVKEEKKVEKVRTTVTLTPDTLAALDALKIDARKKGREATYSAILEEAITDLSQKYNLLI